jgi:hypothetical protein
MEEVREVSLVLGNNISSLLSNSLNKYKRNPSFLHSPFCRAEGLCQHVTIKEGLVVEMLTGPMRAK